eukprot:scaffold1007_cov176-Amphora_coffeaeformis.AAC.24
MEAMTRPVTRTSLQEAVMSGNVAEVRRVLDEGADPYEQDPDVGWMPIDPAILCGHLEVAQEMVRRHPDLVHCGNDRNMTALHAAACGADQKHTEMAMEFLRHGADVSAVNVEGETPLNLARKANPSTVVVLEEVLRRNAQAS